MANKQIRGADLFCGAGGFTEGFRRACARIGLKYDFVAVNHWDVAIATHSANHPEVRHILDDMQRIKPRNVFPKGSIEILLAAPECTHHSRAAGGVPRNPQSRATAGFVIKWARALSPKVIIVENVKEFREWGPLGTNGKPLKRKKGELFNKWLKMLKRLGYSVDHRVLCAADYGDPTTRERLFIIARADGAPITWPEPTHTRNGDANMFGSVRKWKSAKDHVIDWTDAGESIFSRKKPLSPNTMRRIYAGLAKFGGKPFLAMLYGTNDARDLERPAPTVTPTNHTGLVQPFICNIDHNNSPESDNKSCHDINKPVPTVMTMPGLALAQPFLLKVNGGDDKYSRTSSVNDPVGAVTAHPSIALVEPFVLPQQSAGRARSTEEPLPTVSADGAISLIEPYMVALKHTTEGDNRRVYDTKKPMPTITTRPDLALAQPFLVQYNGQSDAVSVDHPVPTVPTHDRFGLAQPFLVEYHGSSYPGGERIRSVDEPVPTIATANQYALVVPGLDGYALDIRFRMLKVRELARAQGFADDYQFTGTQESQKKQIGNAVPGGLAEALCYSQLARMAAKAA